MRLHSKRKTARTKKEVSKDLEAALPSAASSVKSVIDWSKSIFGKDRQQKRAFEVLVSSFLLTLHDEKPEDALDDSVQAGRPRCKHPMAKSALLKLCGAKNGRRDKSLICLLHGPGGSGKSTVVNAVKCHAKEHCGLLKHPFTSRTIIVTAVSGVVATSINGETTHSVLGLNKDAVDENDANSEEWVDAKPLTVDEVSFAAEVDFVKAHEHLKVFMNEHCQCCGGLNIVFAGDFSQMEPVGRDPISKDGKKCPEFHGALNALIELNGKWRLTDAAKCGDIMQRMRAGEPTHEDINLIDKTRCRKFEKPPPSAQIASHTNKIRDAVDAAVFNEPTENHNPGDGGILKSACVVFIENAVPLKVR